MAKKEPPLLLTHAKDPLDSAWRLHMKEGQWVPDVSVQFCMICRQEFTFWNRKHHCRRCGAVVCYTCCNNYTHFTNKDIAPSSAAKEDARVCDLCIRFIDAQLAFALHKRYGHEIATEIKSKSDVPTVEMPKSASNRSVLSKGKYRANIKESEGNRFIQDKDL